LQSQNKKTRIGVTGGIASGKTFATNYFRSLGYPVFYADILATQLMIRNPEIKSQIVKEFGAESYLDGRLNKEYLASRVFSFPEEIKKLNAIVHPAVIARSAELMTMALEYDDVVFYEAALVFESGMTNRFDYILLITADRDIRLKRAVARGGLSEKDVTDRMANQISEDEKIRLSHFVIVNDQTEHEFIDKLQKFVDIIEKDKTGDISSFPYFIQ